MFALLLRATKLKVPLEFRLPVLIAFPMRHQGTVQPFLAVSFTLRGSRDL